MARKMKVLIVEDDPNRMEIFNELFVGDEVTWAKTASQGIKWLGRETYDLVMLDHDLTAKSTGREVALHMATMEDPPPYAIVHSWNPTGAKAIGQILADAGIRHLVLPFGTPSLEHTVMRIQQRFQTKQAIQDRQE